MNNISKLNKIANTWGSTGNMEMDYMRNKINEISQRPEEIAKSEALAEHFSDPKTYRDWAHDSNAWFHRSLSKLPGAIPNAIGGIYDLGTGLLDLGINAGNYGIKKLQGKGDTWNWKDYTHPEAANNWGYNIGGWLNDKIGRPITNLNVGGKAIDYTTTAPELRKDWKYSSLPQYSEALQKSDPLGVMGMLEDAAAEAVVGAGAARLAGNLISVSDDIARANKWYAKQNDVIRNHLENKRQAYLQPVYDEVKKKITPTVHRDLLDQIHKHVYQNYKGDRSFIDEWFARRRADKVVKPLANKDKLIQYMEKHPWDYKTSSNLQNTLDYLQDNRNTPDIFTFYKEYQKYPIPPKVTTLGKAIEEFGSEPLFKGGWIGDSRIKDAKQWFNQLIGNKNKYRGTEDRLWFSPLPEVSLGYGGDLAIVEVPPHFRSTVSKLKTPHIGSTVKADDLLNDLIDKDLLKQVHGSTHIGQSPDYEAAIPINIVDDILDTGKSKIYQQIDPPDLTSELSRIRTVSDPIPASTLNTRLSDYDAYTKYNDFKRTYLGARELPYSSSNLTLRRPKVFNFSPYPGIPWNQYLGNRYYNQAGQLAAANVLARNGTNHIPEYLKRK